MKINLSVHLTPSETYGNFADVEAEFLFDIAPHLADVATFAVHQEPFYSHRWSVTNVETGLHVVQAFDRARAIEAARKLLKTKTPKDFKRAYSKAADKYPQIINEIAVN